MTDPESPDFVPEEASQRPRRAAPRAVRSRRQQLRATRLELGGVIGNTFSIWFGNFLPFSALSLLIYSPLLIVTWFFFDGSPTTEEVRTFSVLRLLAERVFFASLLTGTLVFGVVMQLRGKKAATGRCLTVGLSRVLHVFAITFLIALLCGLCLVPGFLLAFLGVPALAVLAFFFSVIPMAIIYVTYIVSVPAVIVERVGVGTAMARSSALTKGSRMTVFGIAFVIWLLILLASWIFSSFVLGALLTGLAVPTIVLVQSLFNVLISPLTATFPAVIYHDLRVGKEGVDVKDLAAVFD